MYGTLLSSHYMKLSGYMSRYAAVVTVAHRGIEGSIVFIWVVGGVAE